MKKRKTKRVAQRTLPPRLTCLRPDHDVPGLVCGHPLPCPRHTVVLDLSRGPATLTIPLP
jgi:hypothetical protein